MSRTTSLLALICVLAVGCDLANQPKSDAQSANVSSNPRVDFRQLDHWEIISESNSKRTLLLNSSTGQTFVLESAPDGKAFKWVETTRSFETWPIDVKVLGDAKQVPPNKRIEGGVYLLGNSTLGRWDAKTQVFTR
jgi:hypothetical protein